MHDSFFRFNWECSNRSPITELRNPLRELVAGSVNIELVESSETIVVDPGLRAKVRDV
jgi:hypothetical protein